MALLETLFPKVFEKVRNEAVAIETKKAAESEPYAANLSDGTMWNPVGGGFLVNPLNFFKTVNIQEKLFQHNALYRRILEIIRDHVKGNGVERSVSALVPELAQYEYCISELIEKFWNDPRNNLDHNLDSFILEDSAFGECCLTQNTNDKTGEVTIGYIPAKYISEVDINPFNVTEILAIKTSKGEWVDEKRSANGKGVRKEKMKWFGEEKTFIPIKKDYNLYETGEDGKTVMLTDPGTKLQKEKPNPRYDKLNGDVFFWRSNNLLGSTRGVGDLWHISDWANFLDNIIELVIERYQIQNSVILDVTVDGTQKQVDEATKDMAIPRAPGFFAHNKKMTLEVKSPNGQMGDFSTFIQEMRALIGGAAGVPEFMLGFGGDTNVATAKEQAPALYAKFNNRRMTWESRLNTVLRYVVERANDAGMIYAATVADDGTVTKGETKVLTVAQLDNIWISATFLPFERTDAQSIGKNVSAIGDALIVGENQKWISHDLAKQTYRAQIGQLGVDVDADSEDQKLAEEATPTITGATGKQLGTDYLTNDSVTGDTIG